MHFRTTVLLLLVGLAGAPSSAWATTYNTPTVDGVVDTTGTDDWDANELLASDPLGDSDWAQFNDLLGVWATWDADGITFAVTGNLWDTAPPAVGANAVNLYIDVDFGAGTGISNFALINANALGAITRNLWRPLTVAEPFGADFGYTTWAGQFDLGFLDLTDPQLPVNRLDEITEARDLAGYHGYELFIPWTVFYPDAGGGVPPGTRIAVVVAQVGGGDSLSPESIPDGAIDRSLESSVVFTVDADADGVPDQGWPPSGSIAGTVTLEDSEDVTSRVAVSAWRDGVEVGSTFTGPGGGDYVIDRLEPGTYTVQIEAEIYTAAAQQAVISPEGGAVTGVDFFAELVGGFQIDVEIVDGPEATARTRRVFLGLFAADPADPMRGSEFRQLDILGTGDSLQDVELRVADGDYLLLTMMEAARVDGASWASGYRVARTSIQVRDKQITEAGVAELAIRQASRLAFVRDGFGVPEPPPFLEEQAYIDMGLAAGETDAVHLAGNLQRVETVLDEFAAVSIPAEDAFSYRSLTLALVDDDGLDAVFDDVAQSGVMLRFSLVDPAFASDGDVTFWTVTDTTTVAQPVEASEAWASNNGFSPTSRSTFLFTDDVQEVVRIEADHPMAGIADTAIRVAVQAPDPDFIELELDATSMTAGEAITLRGRLKDVSGNDVPTSGVIVDMVVEPQGALVLPSAPQTLADGSFEAVFQSNVAGSFDVQARVSNAVVSEIFTIEVVPADAATLIVVPGFRSATSVEVNVTLIDEFQNGVPSDLSGLQITTGPPEIVASAPSSLDLDASGSGQFAVELNEGVFGVLDVAVRLAALPQPETTASLEVRPYLVGVDEVAPETDDDHNSDPGIDLTTLFAVISGEDLIVRVPFDSDFDGAHMVLLIEYAADSAGAFGDFFGFPVSFSHEFLPDYVFTYKYAADDYADFRRQGGSGPGSWDWYDIASDTWVTDFTAGVNAKEQGWVAKSASEVTFTVPTALLGPGFVPGVDPVRLQVYVPQETDGEKRPALDSIPHDSTQDMTGEWWLNLTPSFLSNWVEAVPSVETSTQVSLEDVGFNPVELGQGESTVLSARAGFAAAPPAQPLMQVFADMRPLGGAALAPLFDDGNTEHGDAVAGDGVFSLMLTVPAQQPPGEVNVVVRAVDGATGAEASAAAALTVAGEVLLESLVSVEDPEGDDHGPNRPNENFLFYTYPTNSVFFPGVFDLLGLEVLDAGDRLVFEVTLREITDPAQPGAANWGAPNPPDESCPEGLRTDLNLQNIVMFIDSKRGGSENGLPGRFADIASQDAWETAIVGEGWGKWIIQSQGSSSQGDWQVLRDDPTPDSPGMTFCVDQVGNKVIFEASKSLFEIQDDAFPAAATLSDLPDVDAVRAVVQRWDIITIISSHDGESNDQNFGALRAINEGGAEWQFGGGRNGEDFRERDPNVIDLLTYTGVGKTPGRLQEDQLNFLSPVAIQRFADGANAVQLEAEELVDVTPPIVEALNNVWAPLARGESQIETEPRERAVVPWLILSDSPAVVTANITDDLSGVAEAALLWRGLGEPASANRRIPMGQLRGDLERDAVVWVADIPWDEVEAATNVVSTFDDDVERRYVVVSIEAVDQAPAVEGVTEGANRGASQEALLEVPIAPLEQIVFDDITADLDSGDEELVTLNLPEGTRIVFDGAAVEGLRRPVRMVYSGLARSELQLDPAPDRGNNPSVLQPGNRFLGVARSARFFEDASGSANEVNLLPAPMELSVHFPRYLWEGERPEDLQLFRFQDMTQRWLLAAGHGESDGGSVTANLLEPGIFGVFTKSSRIDEADVVTGLQIGPTPFSPNDDGIADICTISYVLPAPINEVVIEVFDMRGARVRTLTLLEGRDFTGRTLNEFWDGRDELSRYVPMGLYIVRVEAKDRDGNIRNKQQRAVAVVR